MEPPRGLERRPAPTFRRIAGWLLAAVVLASAGAGLLWKGSVETGRAEAHRNEGENLALLAIRLQLTRSQLDELTLRMVEPFGLTDPKDLEHSIDHRLEIVAAGRLQLAAIAEQRGSFHGQAQQLLDQFEQWGPTQREPDLAQLLDGAGIAQFEAAPPPASPPTIADSIAELVWLDQAAILTLHEALIANHYETPTPASGDIAEFFADGATYLPDDGGYLGPDPEAPISHGWIPIDIAMVHESAAVDSISKTISSTDLWKSDQWVRSWVDNELPRSPLDLATLVSQTQQATRDIRRVVDARMADRRTLSIAGADAASQQAEFARWSGVLVLTFASAASAVSVLNLWRRSRRIRQRVNVDPLTGAGTRHVLYDRTAKLLTVARLSHHAVVMIDMDRFKLTNDTYGHAAGDQLLQQLTRGLRRIAESSLALEATVVRLGGDEFALTVHHHQPISETSLRRELDVLRTRHITLADGRDVPLRFSYGIEQGIGSPQLQDLLDAAGLAAYQEKAVRTSDHRGSNAGFGSHQATH